MVELPCTQKWDLVFVRGGTTTECFTQDDRREQASAITLRLSRTLDPQWHPSHETRDPMTTTTTTRGLALVIALLAFAGAACGNDDKDSSASSGSTTSPTAATTSEPPTTTDAPTTTIATTTTAKGAPKSIQWINAQPGTCIQVWPVGTTFTTVNSIDCSEPHVAEVMSNSLTGVSPSTGIAGGGPQEECAGKFAAYAGKPLQGSGYEVSWLEAAPSTTSPGANLDTNSLMSSSRLVCLAEKAGGGQLTGSVKA